MEEPVEQGALGSERPDGGTQIDFAGHPANEFPLQHAHMYWEALIGPSWEQRVTHPDWPILRVIAGHDYHAGLVELHAMEDYLSETGARPAMVQILISPAVARDVAWQILRSAYEAQGLAPDGWDAARHRAATDESRDTTKQEDPRRKAT